MKIDKQELKDRLTEAMYIQRDIMRDSKTYGQQVRSQASVRYAEIAVAISNLEIK